VTRQAYQSAAPEPSLVLRANSVLYAVLCRILAVQPDTILSMRSPGVDGAGPAHLMARSAGLWL